MGTLGGYIMGQMVGRAQARSDAARDALIEAGHTERVNRLILAGPTSEEMAEAHERRMVAEFGPDWRAKRAAREAAHEPRAGEILDLKKRLAAARAVRDSLREALAKVAPDHPLVSPLTQNPLLQEVATAAAERVTNWDDEV